MATATPKKKQSLERVLTATPHPVDRRDEYEARAVNGKRLIAFIKEQLVTMIADNDLTLAFPVDGRVKDLDSILNKCKRKEIELTDFEQFDDFVGIRVVSLFKRDIPVFDEFIKGTFKVIESENTFDRLSENTFGYQSNHYVIQLPEDWSGIPSLKGFGKMRAEIQVRTLSQHMWAAVSHKLQYKIEATVPYELRRSINRASAILELIDIEFDRVMDDRDSYVEVIEKSMSDSEALNVDLLKEIMTKMLPKQHLDGGERYDHLFIELERLSVRSVQELKEMIEDNLDAALTEDKRYASDPELNNYSNAAFLKKGIYFNQMGLMRNIMSAKFGQSVLNGIMVK
ncbi:GTP pyrophosphokinase [Sphingomonas faeni]|uniref:GTP pyrophosphokinase n=1 Tax=Sphingomonas faeni TaxID=185950 RepID=UPI00335485C9